MCHGNTAWGGDLPCGLVLVPSLCRLLAFLFLLFAKGSLSLNMQVHTSIRLPPDSGHVVHIAKQLVHFRLHQCQAEHC